MSHISGLVTWQDAESAMQAAVEYLGALPDRERGFLSAGQRSCWPEIVRERTAGDYAEHQALGEAPRAPRPQLGRKEMGLLGRMLLDPDAAMLAVPEGHRRLVGRVLVGKLDGRGEGFTWSRIWEMEGGRACGVTSDALRMRYERAVGKVAVRMEKLGIGPCGALVEEGCGR